MDIIQQALTQGLTPAIVVVIYLVITKIIDTRKEEKQLKVSDELVNSVNNISRFLTSITDDIISKNDERSRMILKLAFSNAEKNMFEAIRDTVVANHFDTRKEYVGQSISLTVNLQYYELISYLSSCENKGAKASDVCKDIWKTELCDALTTIVFDGNLDTILKINEVEKRLSSMFGNYYNYVNNRLFNS